MRMSLRATTDCLPQWMDCKFIISLRPVQFRLLPAAFSIGGDLVEVIVMELNLDALFPIQSDLLFEKSRRSVLTRYLVACA